MNRITAQTFAQRFPALASAVGDAGVTAFLDAVEVLELCAGEALIAEGTPTDALFLVWDGELDVVMDTDDGPHEVWQVQSGAFLGEVSLLDPGPATASVVSEQGCVALRLTRERLETLRRQQPVAAAALLRQLSQVLAERTVAATELLRQTSDDPTRSAARRATTSRLIDVHAALYRG